MELNNISGTRHRTTGNIIPLSELICPECGDPINQCRAFQYFPKNQCGSELFDSVEYVIFDMEGKSFTSKQFHKLLAAEVYPDFRAINEPEELAIELLDIYLDLGVVEDLEGNGNLFKVV